MLGALDAQGLALFRSPWALDGTHLRGVDVLLAKTMLESEDLIAPQGDQHKSS